MTRDQMEVLIPALSGFHQDFDLDEMTEWDVLVWHARGLEADRRGPLYSALEILLSECETEDQFLDACWSMGAHFAPTRAELERFVAWARTPEGDAEIAAPGPTSTYVDLRANLDRR